MMLKESSKAAGDTEIGNIDAAADILRRMLLELQGLEVTNARLHYAMSNTRYSLSQRLAMLSGIAELLKASHSPVQTRELCQRAKKLIFQLADELEQLAHEAEHEFDWTT